ncbi:MAG: hypothetical protein Q3965_05540 [Rothia sp. (in: high G+C Gram-positive bacteria)]|nr:hypothetical protein [Rothia sp. (in: high G+C Gram-positive bacteria)]
MKQRPALYLPTDAEMLALRQDVEQTITFDEHLLVRATGLGGWGGSDVRDAMYRIRGELGHPHISFLPELANRGYYATVQGRTLATLEGLSADITASGWRLTSGYAKESDLAATTLASDINMLADAVGKETSPEGSIKVRITGPLTLAAKTFLTSGEAVLHDYGARRDLRDSLLAGLKRLIAKLKEAAPGNSLILQFEEPLAPAVLAGEVKTSSGYATIRAVPRHEAVETFALLHAQVAELGASTWVRGDILALHPEIQELITRPVLNMGQARTRDWEPVARLLEAGALPVFELVSPFAKKPVADLASTFWSTWADLGLSKNLINRITLTETAGLERIDPQVATTVLHHLTETARALSEIAYDA